MSSHRTKGLVMPHRLHLAGPTLQGWQRRSQSGIERFKKGRTLDRIIIIIIVSKNPAVDGPSTCSAAISQDEIPNSFISFSDQMNIGNGCASVLKTKRSSGTGALSRQSRYEYLRVSARKKLGKRCQVKLGRESSISRIGERTLACLCRFASGSP